MDLHYGEAYEAFRAELREFLKGWPLRGAEAAKSPAEQEQLFRQRGVARGYVYRGFPAEYGGSGQPSDALKDRIIQEEYARSGAPGNRMDQGAGLLAPTLLEFGSEAQKRRFIPPTLAGSMRWCQGYSEPNAGSDLASLQATATLEGDHFVLRGQKIWTSNAREADMMFGLFRTEPAAPKHAGISYLLLDMRAPGIDVRPLRMMQGGEDFCEVFLSDVRVPAKNIVGRRGEGWNVSRATLKHERMLIGDTHGARMAFEALVALAREAQRDGRPAIAQSNVRQRLAEIAGYLATHEWAVARMLTAIHQSRDLDVLSELLMTKLFGTNLQQSIAKLALELIPEAGLREPDREEVAMGLRAFTPGRWVSHYMFTLAAAIAVGTSNVQRNIIGEKVLGLPRDPRPGR
jgi:alkylation response protein AidB-like acyl-CoA dehydrogenase